MPADVLKIALPLPLPRLFDYAPPAGVGLAALRPGQRVRVPLGTRELTGVVEAVGPAEAHTAELRPATALLDPDPLLQGELLASLRWLARYVHAPPGEVYATALPAALRRGEPLPDTAPWAWRLTEAGATGLPGLRRGSRPRRLAELLQTGACEEDALDAALDGWRDAARALARRGYAERVRAEGREPKAEGPGLRAQGLGPRAEEKVAPPSPQPSALSPPFPPNAEQRHAIAAVAEAAGRFAPFLLDGVTGSGKTEVYLHAIAQCLARGRQALVLVPEIGLTPQLLERFRARLGVPVHATHSGLSDGERARVWAAARSGQARVIVGTRSAVFTPLPEAGLIVVDEEHDASYKQQDGIRYHARDFALVRAKALDVPVVLGSATPSLESLHNARAGRYAHLRLRARAGEAKAPRVRVLDVRKRPLQAGLSPEALEAMRGALDAGGQVLVFKNRRGYAPVLLCHDCGWSAQCRRCSTPEHGSAMTVHAGGRRLQCHHCGARQPRPLACPDCGGLALQPQGIGTERLEELLAERYADVPVLRVDSASTRRKDGLAKALAALGDAPGMLVGTQMLTKGHDLPRLTLVCVVGIDEGLFSADFRAREKLAQLLIQVSGRAGRATRPGEVLLQTHHPQHPLLSTLIAGGYHAFAEAELAEREAAELPPFSHLALLRAEARHADAPMAFLHAARALLEPHADANQSKGWGAGRTQSRSPDADPPAEARPPARSNASLHLHGPFPAPMPRRAGMHRAQLLLSAASRPPLHALLEAGMPALYELPEARRVRWSLDVDPIDLY